MGFSNPWFNFYGSNTEVNMLFKLFSGSNLQAYSHISIGNIAVDIWIFNQQIHYD